MYEHGSYTSFDAPGASSEWFGTLPNSANNRGDVVGDYYDSDGGVHGFIRDARGTIKSIDVPITALGLTCAIGINDQGAIVGTYWDAAGFRHGYILSQGQFNVFDFPNTANTILTGINNRGDLVGYGYNDFSEPSFAFVALRHNNGK